MTLPELLLWKQLRGDRIDGLHFRKQHPIGPYILDFYCSSARLAVEVDGLAHDDDRQSYHDARRDSWLAEHDIRVLRIPARDVLNDEAMEGVLASIVQAAAPSTASRSPSPVSLRFTGEEPRSS